jgi:methyltransferase-like protein/cyclopropane fatty-acyl-phospholipid synthase-like methyltransferase
MSEPRRTSYDDIPYLNRAHSATHPDRLATLAHLLGLEPPPVEHCRVLELGCANGHNLLPMAANLPGSEFVGVDLSARQIADGQAAVKALGLTNLRLCRASLADVDEAYGSFDYIITHGVYSWVSPAVQAAILAVCAQRLTADGVAYVSYNTYPGWYTKQRVRDMMLHHVRGVADPYARLRRAREFVHDLAELLAPEGNGPVSAYAATLRAEAQIIAQQDDDYIYHEYLEDDNRPVYFHEFMAQAEHHGLQYLGDADRGLVAVDHHGEAVVRALKALAGGIVEQEQFLDYLYNRTFRCTLLCRAGHGLNRNVTGARVRPLWVRSELRPASPSPDVTGTTLETFAAGSANAETGEPTRLAVSQPVTKAALVLLAEAWPRALPFEALLDQACSRAYAGQAVADSPVVRAREADGLALNVLQGFAHQHTVIELHAFGPRLARQPGEQPLASPVARYQATLQHTVTNAFHQTIRTGSLSWYLLPFLDGTRDRAALAELIVANPNLAMEQDGKELTGLDPTARRAIAREKVEECLRGLAEVGLLVEPDDRLKG